MTSFSERFGYSQPKLDLADGEMPDTLRNGLWDAISLSLLINIGEPAYMSHDRYSSRFRSFVNVLWFNFFKKPLDTIEPRPEDAVRYIRTFFYNSSFIKIYELIEFLSNLDDDKFESNQGSDEFAEFCNMVLERERAAFRFAGSTLVKITNADELKSLEDSLAEDVPTAIRMHFTRAAELYSQRPTADYRNSIKESISAVESTVAFVTNAKKAGGVSVPIRKAVDQFQLHPALRDGFEKLYSYTSDADGIRHALMGESDLSQADAKYMLVACSAFSNYLLALKAAQSAI
jgi:hypothetical protein